MLGSPALSPSSPPTPHFLFFLLGLPPSEVEDSLLFDSVLVPCSLYQLLSLVSQLPHPDVTAGQGRDQVSVGTSAWLNLSPWRGNWGQGRTEPTCRGRGCREAESTDYSRTGYPTPPSLAPLLLASALLLVLPSLLMAGLDRAAAHSSHCPPSS